MEAEALKNGETPTDVKGGLLFLILAATLAMGRSEDGWENTGGRGGQGTGLLACCTISEVVGKAIEDTLTCWITCWITAL